MNYLEKYIELKKSQNHNEIKNLLYSLYITQKKTLLEIASILNLTESRISQLVNKYKVNEQYKIKKNKQNYYDCLYKMYEIDCLSILEISKILNKTIINTLKLLNKHGFNIRLDYWMTSSYLYLEHVYNNKGVKCISKELGVSISFIFKLITFYGFLNQSSDTRYVRSIQTKIKNNTLYTINSIGINSQIFFNKFKNILKKSNIKYNKFIYGIIDKKRTYKYMHEYAIDVSDISVKKYRLLDSYIRIQNREINFEFDEPHHKKSIKYDIIRENEILYKKPNLEIYRISEKYYNSNPEETFNDMLEILRGNDLNIYTKKYPKIQNIL